MSALRKTEAQTLSFAAADMTLGQGADMMLCSNIEAGDMISGGNAQLMLCSN